MKRRYDGADAPVSNVQLTEHPLPLWLCLWVYKVVLVRSRFDNVSATSEACRFFLGERPRREKSKEWIS